MLTTGGAPSPSHSLLPLQTRKTKVEGEKDGARLRSFAVAMAGRVSCKMQLDRLDRLWTDKKKKKAIDHQEEPRVSLAWYHSYVLVPHARTTPRRERQDEFLQSRQEKNLGYLHSVSTSNRTTTTLVFGVLPLPPSSL